eukprot:6738042-Pyramimonas_sp.AAC.1
MDDGALVVFFRIWEHVQRFFQVPKCWALRLIALLPKPPPEGGDRPIGAFPSPLRTWPRWARWKVAGARGAIIPGDAGVAIRGRLRHMCWETTCQSGVG